MAYKRLGVVLAKMWSRVATSKDQLLQPLPMKTQKQIATRVKSLLKNDVMGFETNDLIACLDFENASEFLDEKPKEKEWNFKNGPDNADPTKIKREMVEYLPIAWDKALNHRDLSATRSIARIRQWLWLLDDEDTLKFLDKEDSYKNYGAPILKEVSEKYGYAWPSKNKSAVLMADGKRCETCEAEGFGGCGK